MPLLLFSWIKKTCSCAEKYRKQKLAEKEQTSLKTGGGEMAVVCSWKAVFYFPTQNAVAELSGAEPFRVRKVKNPGFR